MSLNLLIVISIIVMIIVIISLCIVLVSKSKKKVQEPSSSILDVNDIGVSNNTQEFSYGYEKEETVVMNPVDVEDNDDSKKVDDKNIEDKS